MANDITPKTLTQRQSTGKAAIFHSITRVKTAYGRKVYETYCNREMWQDEVDELDPVEAQVKARTKADPTAPGPGIKLRECLRCFKIRVQLEANSRQHKWAEARRSTSVTMAEQYDSATDAAAALMTALAEIRNAGGLILQFQVKHTDAYLFSNPSAWSHRFDPVDPRELPARLKRYTAEYTYITADQVKLYLEGEVAYTAPAGLLETRMEV